VTEPAPGCIEQRIRDLGGWCGETLTRVWALILRADPETTEELKWRGTPVCSHHGIVGTGEAHAKVAKLKFARGARLPDPQGLFDSGLGGSTRRAIDLREGERIDARALRALVRVAVALNAARAKPTGRGAGGPRPVISSRRTTPGSRRGTVMRPCRPTAFAPAPPRRLLDHVGRAIPAGGGRSTRRRPRAPRGRTRR
jgi:hypothetical protein